MRIALTREISPAITRCELTHLARAPIDLEKARAQHAEYESALADAGCSIVRLPSDAHMPDSVFIEDTAVVLPEVAVITRPGASSRRAETSVVADALQAHRPLARIEPPGTMDGGDVLVVGRHVFIGLSTRTNGDAALQLRVLLAPYGYSLTGIEVTGCLHLKSAVTCVGENLLLINPSWLPADPLVSFDRVEIDPHEPMAANAVLAGQHVLCAAAFPRTTERLQQRGVCVRTVNARELAKAEGALTCCSLLFDSDAPLESVDLSARIP